VAGADPAGRAGQSSVRSTHLIKIAVELALGKRTQMEVFGTDYATPDGTCIRDYVHVTDLIAAHLDALRHLRRGGPNLVLNCGYGHGHSVLQVLDAVKRAAGTDLSVKMSGRRPGDPAALVARADRIRTELGWQPKYDDLDTIVAHALAWERKLPAKPLAAA
jgi:UDP-glucose 4-epimerase